MSSLYKKLNLLKLEDLFNVKLVKFMYLYYNKKHQNFLIIFKKNYRNSLLPYKTSIWLYVFFTKNVKNKYPKNSILYKGTKIWSELKPELKIYIGMHLKDN